MSRPRFIFLYIAPRIAGVLCLLLGSCVIYGWHTHNLFLMQLHEGFVAMRYNAAVGFVLSGIGLIFLSSERPLLGAVFGALLVMLSAVSLSEYIFGIETHISTLFLAPGFELSPLTPVKIAPNAATGFLVIGLALILDFLMAKSRWRMAVARTLGGAVLVLGTVSLIGYAGRLQSAYEWKAFAPMAVHVALGFVIFSTGFLAYTSGRNLDRADEKNIYWLAGIIASILLMLSTSLSIELRYTEQQFLKSNIAEQAHRVAETLRSNIYEDLIMLLKIKDKWDRVGAPTLERQKEEARSHLSDDPLLRMLAWVDETHTVRWTVSIGDIEKKKSLQAFLSHAKERMSGLDVNNAHFLSSEDIRKDHIFLMAEPLEIRGSMNGFLIAAFDETDALEHFELADFAKNFDFVAEANGASLFTSVTNDLYSDTEWKDEASTTILNDKWIIKIWPKSNFLMERQTMLPMAVLLSGGLFSLLVAALFYFVGMTRRHILLSNEKEKRLEAIMKIVVGGVVISDEHGIIMDFSPGAEHIFGYTREELIGKNVTCLMPESERASHDSHMREYTEKGRETILGVAGREVIAMRKNGQSFPVELAVNRILLGDQRGFIAIIRDISERKQLENDLIGVANMLEESLNEIYIFNAETLRFLMVNKGGRINLGYTLEELKKMTTLDIKPEFTETDFRALLAPLISREKEKIVRHNIHLRKDGSFYPAETHSQRALYQGQDVIFQIVIDETEHKRVEKLKDEFISTVSHELRTPLTSIRGSLGLILSETVGKIDEKAKSLIDIAYKNCDRLSLLINDILDLEKIESGEMEFDYRIMDVSALLRKSVDLNRMYGEKFNVSYSIVEPTPSAKVFVDEGRFIQVMANLLSNAAKFTHPGDRIDVSVRKENGYAHIAVTDHGPGIPAGFQKKIFSKFAQADSSDTKSKGGTGLGLNISRTIIEHMKGKLYFTTQQGEGTTFYIDLPVTSDDDIKGEKK